MAGYILAIITVTMIAQLMWSGVTEVQQLLRHHRLLKLHHAMAGRLATLVQRTEATTSAVSQVLGARSAGALDQPKRDWPR